jgi:hypothetical protein
MIVFHLASERLLQIARNKETFTVQLEEIMAI